MVREGETIGGLIGVLYEHPEWFKPLFAEMERRQLRYEPVLAHEARFDPVRTESPYDLVVNRMSPSSYLRGHGSAIFFTREYLAHLETIEVSVVNGLAAWSLETSKASQIALYQRLGLPYPRSIVVNHTSQIEAAATSLVYPILLKPNIGGSGALMQRFTSPAELQGALDQGLIELGPDRVGIVQEYHPPADRCIVRVEALDHEFLYAIRIETEPEQGFNLCPADICQLEDAPQAAETNSFEFCVAPAPEKRALHIEAFTPPGDVIDAVLAINRAGQLDIGGVEYLQSSRDGRRYFYDINALSNFVTDAQTVVGFDPFERFVDYLERRLEQANRPQERAASAPRRLAVSS